MKQAWEDKPWSHPMIQELYRSASEHHGGSLTELHISRLAPGEGVVAIDWVDQGEGSPVDASWGYQIEYRLKGSLELSTMCCDRRACSVRITGLLDGQDYEVMVSRVNRDTHEVAARSLTRFVRPGHVPGTVINYIHPEDYAYGFAGRSPASPSIARLPDGRLVASHDVFWGGAGQNLTKVFRSDDDGRTWSFLVDLYPCFWGKLFVHRGGLYMLATSTEYGALLIGRSDDGGQSWSAPTKLMEGGSGAKGGPHKAPMPVTMHNGRLWTAIDYGSWMRGGHASGVISVDTDADLLDAANWTATPFLPYDPAWPGAIEGGKAPNLLEGNVVATPDGGLVNLLRYQTEGGKPAYGKAIYLHIDAGQPAAPLRFGKVIDFHGNMSKFTVGFDPVSGQYLSLVSRVTSGNAIQRNVLALVASTDLVHWRVAQDILDYEHNGWSEDLTKVGFQYVDWMVDGDALLFVSRTAINGAYNFHNANYLTFHRIEQFRNLL